MAYPDLATSEMIYRSSTTNQTAGGAAGANKLWLSLWAGEVLIAYDKYTMFEPLVTQHNLQGGWSWEFPVTGRVGVQAVWAAGEELIGGDAAGTTVRVNLDKRPVASYFEEDNIDKLIAQWDYRGEIARQTGLELAATRDKQIGLYIVRAGAEDLSWDDTANSSAGAVATWDTDAGGAGDPRGIPAAPVFAEPLFYDLGRVASSADARANAALKVLECIEKFLVYRQENNMPTDGIYCVLTPQAFQDMRNLGVARDISALEAGQRPMFAGVAEVGGLGTPLTNGLANMSDAMTYNGVMIIKSNHIPQADIANSAAAGAFGEARYCLDCATAGVCGMIFRSDAVAALNLMGITPDSTKDVRRNTTFTVASMFKGTGVLHPESACVLIKPTDATTTASDSSTWDATTKANKQIFYGNSGDAANSVALMGKFGTAGTGTYNSRLRRVLMSALGSNFAREFVPTS